MSLMDNGKRPYKAARMVEGKRPYITYSAWHEGKQCLKRVRIYRPPKLKPHEAARWRVRTLLALNRMLEDGWRWHSDNTWRNTPDGVPLASEIEEMSRVPRDLEGALEWATRNRGSGVKTRTGETYRNVAARLLDWAEQSGHGRKMPLRAFGKQQAMQVSEWLIVVRGVSAVTRNNYFQTCRTLWNHLAEAGAVDINPFAKIQKLPQEERGRNVAFTALQASRLAAWLDDNDPALRLVTMIIYHCFARPSEIYRLRVRDIDLERWLMCFPATITKTRKAGNVPIPKALRGPLARHLAGCTDGTLHLITSAGRPGRKMAGENTFAERHRKAIQACGLAGLGLTLYSWKHTGACSAYDAGMPLLELRDRCRHGSVEMTERYLEDLRRVRPGQEYDW